MASGNHSSPPQQWEREHAPADMYGVKRGLCMLEIGDRGRCGEQTGWGASGPRVSASSNNERPLLFNAAKRPPATAKTPPPSATCESLTEPHSALSQRRGMHRFILQAQAQKDTLITGADK